MGTQLSCWMLGSAVSSSTPNDFQPPSHKGLGGLAADRLPRSARTVGEGIDRGRDDEGARLGGWFSQQADERVVDAWITDARGSEKELHAASWSRARGCGGRKR